MQQTAPLEIGIPVIDLEGMVDFYTRVFSCEEVRRADIPAELSSQIRVAESGYTNVWLQLPGGEVIKLVAPSEPPAPAERLEYSSTRTGIAYFTLYCDDITTAVATAEEAGARLLSERTLVDEGVGVRLGFLSDPEGNIFEFVQA